MTSTAADLLTALGEVADPVMHPNRHYRGGAEVLGVRMGTLFDNAKRHSEMPLAELLAADSDPVVSKPVGIVLKHAGAVAPDQVYAFLDRMGDRLPAPVRRQARAKLTAAGGN